MSAKYVQNCLSIIVLVNVSSPYLQESRGEVEAVSREGDMEYEMGDEVSKSHWQSTKASKSKEKQFSKTCATASTEQPSTSLCEIAQHASLVLNLEEWNKFN